MKLFLCYTVRSPSPDAYAYNTIIIRGLTLVDRQHDSPLLYNKLLEGILTPDNLIYTHVLKACSRLKPILRDKHLHA